MLLASRELYKYVRRFCRSTGMQHAMVSTDKTNTLLNEYSYLYILRHRIKKQSDERRICRPKGVGSCVAYPLHSTICVSRHDDEIHRDIEPTWSTWLAEARPLYLSVQEDFTIRLPQGHNTSASRAVQRRKRKHTFMPLRGSFVHSMTRDRHQSRIWQSPLFLMTLCLTTQ